MSYTALVREASHANSEVLRRYDRTHARTRLKPRRSLFIVVVVVATLYVGGEILQPLALAGLLGLCPLAGDQSAHSFRLGQNTISADSRYHCGRLDRAAGSAMAQQVRNLADDLPTYETNLRVKKFAPLSRSQFRQALWTRQAIRSRN